MPYKNGTPAQADYTAGTAGTVTLTGQGNEMYLCAQTADCYWIADGTATSSTSTYLSADSPIVVPCNHPSTISVIGTATGTLYVIDYV